MLSSVVLALIVVAISLRFLQRLREWPRVAAANRFVLISGCDSGFGRAAVIRLAAGGTNVIAGCYTLSGIADLTAECKCLGTPGKVWALHLDITSDESVDACYADTVVILKKHNANLYGLVNNAGKLSVYGPLEWVTMDEYKSSIDVNLLGAIRITNKFLPLIKACRGRIVTTASISGRVHGFYTTPYNVAKFGLETFMDNLRFEMQPFGVSISMVEPGAFFTKILAPEAMIERVDSVWSKLSPQTKADYGEEFKDHFVTCFNAGSYLVSSRRIDWVTATYEHALFAKWPRKRYTVGWDARLLFVPLSYLPSVLQDGLIRFMMGAMTGFRQPAALASATTSSRMSLAGLHRRVVSIWRQESQNM